MGSLRPARLENQDLNSACSWLNGEMKSSQTGLFDLATWGGVRIGHDEMYARRIFSGKDHSLGLYAHQFGRLKISHQDNLLPNEVLF